MLLDLDEIDDLQRRFKNTHPNFQETINRIAEKSPTLQPLGIFALWRRYSKACEQSDQSAVMFEFLQWNKKDIGIESNLHEVLDYAEQRS